MRLLALDGMMVCGHGLSPGSHLVLVAGAPVVGRITAEGHWVPHRFVQVLQHAGNENVGLRVKTKEYTMILLHPVEHCRIC